MVSVQIPLDLLDSSVTGIYMENLISYWFDQGLTPEHSKVLASVLSRATIRNELFVKCLEKEKGVFQTVRNQMMRSLDIWEEVPAWDEVWRLKLAFDRDRKTDWSDNVKLYTVIVCKLLPEMIMERKEHEDVWHTRRGIHDPLHFGETPEWYQEKFKQYQARQAKREESRQRDQEAILRYRALTRGAFDPKASDFIQQLELPLTEDDLRILVEEPCKCPIRWLMILREGGFTDWLYERADPWQPPDFSSRQQKKPSSSSPSTKTPLFGSASNALFGSASNALFGSTSPLPPDFTSSASKASLSGRLPIFGNPSNTTVFGGTSPLLPDFTSSASKASSSTKAPLFGSASNALFGAPPLPPDFTSSASKASSSGRLPLFGSASNALFGAPPLPPDFTSSASKAPSYTSVFKGPSPLPPYVASLVSKALPSTEAPAFATREHGSPVSVSQGPEQVKSGGNLGATVSDSVASEGS
ncbi:hypothetical protein B0J15DRAFT_232370 [Fusarium solani]|uniref:Uncharacterized protein n=1 Tax=Fusarium solani TaxID=169388 RepID=A0A9P9KUJ7_FUSSL|nr:uncharacterized protein B0J15DRAFT_232370 [Fusarium solani]KAH7268729.1 hypothetical protein B0J15DRAFT_232370 [Fusarium solani]